MKLENIYHAAIKKGIEADIRSQEDIKQLLKQRKEDCDNLPEKEKRFIDKDSLFNPFDDTRIVNDNGAKDIKEVMVGIDVAGSEVLFCNYLKERGTNIDLILSHHPVGKAYARFYDVMDLQIDMLVNQGVNLAFAQDLVNQRKQQVGRSVGSVNHQRAVDIARWLNFNLMCVHTPADNLAYRYLERKFKQNKPKKIKDIVDILLAIPEYEDAALNNNPPKIFLGNKNSRVSNIHIEFTGGTEGPQQMYQKLAASGVDTIVAMHLSESHLKKCRQEHLNVVVASHIASDTLGVNCLLDYLTTKGKLKIHDFSGFRRFSHKKDK
jgi:putative NIF3 family GTP cyclohydrolase 1 type 2